MSAKKFLLPAVGAVVVAGGAAGYWVINKTLLNNSVSPLAIAKAVPDEAYMATYVSTEPQAWAKLQAFGTPEARKLIEGGLKNIQGEMSKSKIDFEKDIKPWVGNSMVAVLPTETNKADFITVISIRDKVSALAFVVKAAQQSDGEKPKEIDYKGVKVYTSDKGGTYSALVNDYIVIASSEKAMQSAIDTSQGAPSMASKPEAEAVLSKPLDLQNSIAQIYLVDYAAAVQNMAAAQADAPPLPEQTLKQLKNVKSMVAGIGVDDQGIRLNAIANLSADAPKLDYKPTAGTVVSQFPAETLALMSGANLSAYWSQMTAIAEKDPTSKESIEQMRQATKSADFDLDKDFFGWMNGEFGIGVIPSDRGLLAQVGVGGVMIFDTSDRKTAENTFSKLDNFAKANGGGMLEVQQRDVQGKKVTEWSTPYGSVLGHGWLDNDSVFVALGGPMVDVATTKPSKPLSNADTFKAATGSLPKQNLGYVYIDMDKTMALVNKFSAMTQSPIPPEPAAVLNSIQGIGMTSSQLDASTGKFEMLIALKKATK
jgi:hypothetical protein